MINLQINKSYKDLVPSEVLQRAALTTLEQAASAVGVELTIVLDSNEHIQALNNQFRGINSPTDVLSFPSGDIEDPDSSLTYLGDIIISIPTAQAQAAHAGHSFHAELQLLTIHGVLHLIGYDHADENEKMIMWQIQSDILKTIGAEINSLPEED